VIENEVLIATRYGRMPTFAVCPEAPGRYPGIIFYMDAPGIREELRNMARRIAREGYFCLLPDLYYRLGSLRFDIPRRDEAMTKVILAAMASLSNAAIAEDTAGLIAFLDGQEKAKSGPLGCVGHCMSGSFMLTVAARYPRMAAAASLYGVNMVTDKPDSPHLLLDQVKGELYMGFAETDPTVPETVIPALKAALTKAGTRHRLEIFPGTHHGFCFAARADYHAAAAEESWTRLFDLWQRNLT